MRGQLLFFNQQRGDGAIRTDEGERLFVEGAAFLPGEVPDGRCAGRVVEFVRGAGTGEHAFAAFDVHRVPEVVAGRARRRSRR